MQYFVPSPVYREKAHKRILKFTDMKKLFILLLAAMTFVACNEEELDMEYYSQLPPEELITTGGGIEYIVRAYGNVDQAALNTMLQTYALHSQLIYWKSSKGWYEPELLGNTPVVYMLDQEEQLRICMKQPIPKTLKDGSKVYTFYIPLVHEGNPIAAIADYSTVGLGRIVAHYDKIVVFQYTDEYGRETRQVYQFMNDREEFLNNYYDATDESLYM